MKERLRFSEAFLFRFKLVLPAEVSVPFYLAPVGLAEYRRLCSAVIEMPYDGVLAFLRRLDVSPRRVIEPARHLRYLAGVIPVYHRLIRKHIASRVFRYMLVQRFPVFRRIYFPEIHQHYAAVIAVFWHASHRHAVRFTAKIELPDFAERFPHKRIGIEINAPVQPLQVDRDPQPREYDAAPGPLYRSRVVPGELLHKVHILLAERGASYLYAVVSQPYGGLYGIFIKLTVQQIDMDPVASAGAVFRDRGDRGEKLVDEHRRAFTLYIDRVHYVYDIFA